MSATVPVGAPSGIIATLSDVIGTPLALRTVFFTVGTLVVPATTNALGQAPLGSVNLPPGSYSDAHYAFLLRSRFKQLWHLHSMV
jgi:hypothetical protein